MFLQEINEIKECIDLSHTPFYYYKDKYALQLLHNAFSEGEKIHEIKKSKWGFLLNKPVLKSMLATNGSKRLEQDDFLNYWPDTHQVFQLSLADWGEYTKHRHNNWRQTSRPGHNLVLQLNFNSTEIAKYFKWLFPKPRGNNKWNPFTSYGHPAQDFTMAWARLDLDFNTGELLIEEIQNDYLREVNSMMKRVHAIAKKEKKEELENYWVFRSGGGDYESLQRYADSLTPYQKIWDEAVLSAVLWFAKAELGIKKVYYHTFEGGKIVKRFEKDYTMPPKSLYTKLPKRFGFELTDEVPQFLKKEQYLKRLLRENNNLKWFVMQL